MRDALCTLVDDRFDQARIIAEDLNQQGLPLFFQAVTPETTTAATLKVLRAARPVAAMIDFRLNGGPQLQSTQLAAQLIRSKIPTVLVTQDRSAIDAGPFRVNNVTIPIFSKRYLVIDREYQERLFRELGIEGMGVDETVDPAVRLGELQDRLLLGLIAQGERAELETLEAKFRLEDREELEIKRPNQEEVDAEFSEFIQFIQKTTEGLQQELKAVSPKKRKKK